jgi:hypothetical protein
MLLLSACNYSRYDYGFFEGNWVLINYLDTVEKYRSVAAANHTIMKEIVLKRGVDSVYVITNGNDAKMYAYKQMQFNNIRIDDYEGDTLDLFITDNGKYLKGKQQLNWSTFVEPHPTLIDSVSYHWPRASKNIIHALTIAGNYIVKNTGDTISFSTSGEIMNWGLFNKYEVCLDKLCRNGSLADVIQLISSNSIRTFEWKWIENELQFAEVGHPYNTFVLQELHQH